MKSSSIVPICLFSLAATVVSCKPKGPAEKAGEQVDKAAEKISDAIDPKGPVEKAGEKVDKALGK